MRNSGIILKLPDERTVIVYTKQPLLKEKGKVIMNLVDEKYNLIKDENGKPKIVIKSIEQYNLENQNQVNMVIGFVD